MTIRELLGRLERVRRSGGSSYVARCPAHDDREPSLSVGEGDDGRLLLYCHAGCSVETVVEAMGLSLADLMPERLEARTGTGPTRAPDKSGLGRLVARYPYTDENGRPLYEVRRYQPKKFRQFRHEGGRCVPGLSDARRVLYRLPEVVDATREGRTVVVVEGEKDADRLASMGLVATTCAMGAGAWRDEYAEALRGAKVAILPDNDEAGHQHARAVARSAWDLAASVRIVELPGLSERGDVSDWLDAGHTVGDLIRHIEEAPRLEGPPGAAGDDGRGGRRGRASATTRLVELVRQVFELVHTPDGTPYLVDEMGVAVRMTSGVGRGLLARTFYESEGRGLTASSISEALPTLEAEARYGGACRDVHVRQARLPDRVVLDLGDSIAALITSGGWRVVPVSETGVVFARPSGFLPLPVPERGGTLDALQRFIRTDDEGLALLCAWLVGALGCPGPYPLLVLNGPQGAGKSTTARLLRALVDPQRGGLTAPPREARDLIITASNTHVVALDNVSAVPPWLSDALCRLATGGGMRTRALYTDGDEAIFEARRPVVLNGIPDLVRFPDLADRSLLVRLEAIRDGGRCDEARFWRAFEAERPRLLGALLDAVACGLRRLEATRPDRLPRMADFARFVLAAEPALPYAPGAFMAAYDAACADLGATLLDDGFAQALITLVADRGHWQGSASELHSALLEHAGHERPPAGWPRGAVAIGMSLSRLEPALLAAGVQVGRERTRTGRTWTLSPKPGGRPSRVSPSGKNDPDALKNVDFSHDTTRDTFDVRDTRDVEDVAVGVTPENADIDPENAACDTRDGCDTLLQNYLGGYLDAPF